MYSSKDIYFAIIAAVGLFISTDHIGVNVLKNRTYYVKLPLNTQLTISTKKWCNCRLKKATRDPAKTQLNNIKTGDMLNINSIVFKISGYKIVHTRLYVHTTNTNQFIIYETTKKKNIKKEMKKKALRLRVRNIYCHKRKIKLDTIL